MIDITKIGIILDNGHGTRNFTQGKCAPDKSIYEGEWVRDAVKRIASDLKVLGFDVRVLVPEITDVPLSTRVSRANKIAKDNPSKRWYFISVHINASGMGDRWLDANGWSVYVSRRASQDSKSFAAALYDMADEFGLRGNRSVPKGRYWEADYKVLKETSMPAILTENMFMDNKQDCKFLLSEHGKATIADVHVFGICKYFGLPYVIKHA